MYVYMYIRMYMCECMYIYTYYIYTYMCVCVCVCVYYNTRLCSLYKTDVSGRRWRLTLYAQYVRQVVGRALSRLTYADTN